MPKHKTTPGLYEEKKLWKKGVKYVCGIDEVGRGSWAGPVTAAAVILSSPSDIKTLRKSCFLRVKDSKQLSPKIRREVAKELKNNVLDYAIGEAEHSVVTKYGIIYATETAMAKAIEGLRIKADFYLLDYFRIKNLPQDLQKSIRKGDRVSLSIAAASIIAKVHRDTSMEGKYHNEYPEYSFDKHKGYGTKIHQNAIKKHGVCGIHRIKFIPKGLVRPATLA